MDPQLFKYTYIPFKYILIYIHTVHACMHAFFLTHILTNIIGTEKQNLQTEGINRQVSTSHTCTHIHTYMHTYLSGMNSFSQSFICVRILRSFLRMGSPAENGPVQYHIRIDQGSYLVLVHCALVTAAAAHLSREKGFMFRRWYRKSSPNMSISAKTRASS